MSTTIREAERILGFLQTAAEIDGSYWDKEMQMKFQILLIKNRQYLNDETNTQSFNNLSNEQARILKDKSIDMTFEQASDIFHSKNYNDPPMRGRQSMSPLVKLGLVYLIDKVISITDVGWKLISGEIEFGSFILDSLLKFQYPNPTERGFQDWNTKPFISTLRLIDTVNKMCSEAGIKAKGISKTEFGIFALSLKSYTDVENVARKILEFRSELESLPQDDRDDFVTSYINDYLADFKNPVKNVKEYTDNMIRYIRQTKYIYIRGKYAHTYIDLEPRRLIEIYSILDSDSGSSKEFTAEDWMTYMGTYGAYELPFETVEKLTRIVEEIVEEIHLLEMKLGIQATNYHIPTAKESLKELIEELRHYRTRLQNLEIKFDYHRDTTKIDEAIEALQDIRSRNNSRLAKKYSVELEKWTNVALNIINDSELIKPNYPVGDDNEPTYTAPSGVPDIECFYENFNAICEVTMLTSRDQWYNEGQPVMRHLREFENKFDDKDSYCLFVAPTIHIDTLNTFWMSVKYEYQGNRQRIIPFTIGQLISILELIKDMKLQGRNMTRDDIQSLYDSCLDISHLPSSTEWIDFISYQLDEWKGNLIA